jgi:hypothetical protein
MFRRGLPPVITSSHATTVIPALAQYIGKFRRVSRARETTSAATSFLAALWLYMVDNGGGDGHTSS